MHAIFDHFAKLVVQTGVAPACISASEHEIRHDSQRADLFVEPDPARLALLRPLGLLGRLCRAVCTLELFHGTPTPHHVEACVSKILAFRRRRRREKMPEPRQWIIASGVPRGALHGFGFEPARGFGPGVYRAPPCLATYVVVARELPATRDTLLLRLLAGKRKVLERARNELLALPESAHERCLAVPIMVKLGLMPVNKRGRAWRQAEEFRKMVKPVLKSWEESMNERLRQGIEQGVEQGIEKGIEQGIEQGIEKGRTEGIARSLVTIYEARFGAVPRRFSAAAAATRDPAVLERWLRLVATASAEEIAAAVVAPKAPAQAKAAATKRAPAAKPRVKARSGARATR